MVRRSREATTHFRRADEEADRGNLRQAFRLFLAAAQAGDVDAQARVVYYYDVGQGVRSNREAALYWYKRAYRGGDAIAAHNIGTIWRDQGNVRRAHEWFQRSADLGHSDSHLEIAKLHLETDEDFPTAIRHLNRVLRSRRVETSDKAEAARLLEAVRKRVRTKT